MMQIEDGDVQGVHFFYPAFKCAFIYLSRNLSEIDFYWPKKVHPMSWVLANILVHPVCH
jgi:hypothetical protein